MSDIWIWHGKNANGAFRRGEVSEESREAVQAQLESMGITVISIDQKGALPRDQSEPKFELAKEIVVPPSTEAANRVNSQIAAMANHVDHSPLRTVQEIICDDFTRIQQRVNERLKDGARVMHVAMNNDARGTLQVVVVIERETA